MASQDHPLHFILVPFMAQGHMNPMIDMAKLFAQRGVMVTVVTTPFNALRFKTIIDRAIESNLPIRILQLAFPWQEVGVPEGCENIDTVPSHKMAQNFFAGTKLLQEPLEQALGELQPIPSCMISDFCLPWTSDTARKFQIPRIIFHGMGCFSLLCIHNVRLHKVRESISSDSEPFNIPGLPDKVEITKAHLPGTLNQPASSDFQEVCNQIIEAETSAYGVVINSFDDLEPRYIEKYKKTKQQKAWCIGPVSLCNKNNIDKFERGNKASIDENKCMEWLDLRESNSVVYVCLGSLCRLIPSQYIEIGLALETADCPFILVIKGSENYAELERWLFEEGFEERTKDRGLIIWGWAPQVLILSHKAVGVFITHCGWNSTLEGVCAGVPMITWPMFAEQFLNEKLLVQILEVGVRVGANEALRWWEEEKAGVTVRKEDIEKAVNSVMDESEEGEIRRKKARELGEMARRAMEEGGSSDLNMTCFIQDIMQQVIKKQTLEDKRDNEECDFGAG